MKKSKSETNIKIQHLSYRFDRKKNFKKVKNLLMFALYLSFIVIIVKFAEGKVIKNAFGKNIQKSNVLSRRTIFENKLMQKYYNELIGDEDIVNNVIKYSEINNIEPSLIIALMKIESAFDPRAINFNTNGSVDRGLCQLNNRTFPMLENNDFYDPEINIKNAAKFLKWCLKRSKNNLVKALAYYNAGIGNVNNRKVGEMTLDYINKIIDEKEKLMKGLKLFTSENSDLFIY